MYLIQLQTNWKNDQEKMQKIKEQNLEYMIKIKEGKKRRKFFYSS